MSKNSVWGARPFLLFAATIVALLLLAPAAIAAPANDAFADAAPIAPESPASGSNEEATKEAGEPNHAGDPGGHSVWFSWTPAKSGEAGVNTSCFDSLDAVIGVYTGTAVGSLTEVASNESGPPPTCFSVTAELEFAVTAGTTYWIAVDGREGDEGSFTLTLRSSPANDDFASATTVPADPPQSILSATRFATREAGEPNHAGDPGGHSVWFAWTPDESERIEVSTCTNFMVSTDTVLAVYTGSAVDSLTPVAANDDSPGYPGTPGCSQLDSGLEFDAIAGTTYRIAVDGASGTSTTFSLRLRGRPQNDDFANATALSPTLPAIASQVSSRMATKEAGEPNHAGDPGGHSLWYSWTAPQSAPVMAATCTHEPAAVPDTLLAVYTGSAVGSLTEVAANDDIGGAGCGNTDGAVSFSAVAGTTYRIAVDSKGNPGRFDLRLEYIADNDAFASPKALGPSVPASAFASNLFATKEAGEPNHAGDPGGHSVWFSWTPDESGPVMISTCPYGENDPDTVLAVYTGTALGGLTEVGANDDSPATCREVGSAVKLNAVAGTTYRIAVDGKGGEAGLFSVELTPPETNDDFADAQQLSANPATVGGSTAFATKQAGEPNHAGDPGGHSVWFAWTPDESGPVDITACGKNGGLDTVLAVYTGSAVNSLTPVAANDDAPSKGSNELCEAGTPGTSEVDFDAVAGTTYRIAIDSKGDVEGRFGIAFERAPENDSFATPDTFYPQLPTYRGGVNKLATKEAGEPNHAGDPGGHSLWYSWTAAKTGPVSIATCTYAYLSDLDTLLAVYTGSAVNSLTQVAANDDVLAKDCRASDSEVVLNAVAGTSYWIAVDGKAGSTGRFNLSIDGVSPHDAFGKPQAFGSAELPIDTWDSNRFATKEAGEPNHAGQAGGASIWLKWSAPRSGKVTVDTCGSSFDTLLAVYTGGSVNGLTPVASNDDGSGKCGPQSKLSIDAVANTVYRIAVDGKNGATGTARIYIDDAPGNDGFAKPLVIRGTRGQWSGGSTLLATKEAGEPNHGGNPGGHSVWFAWTPKQSGTTELNACSRSFDLELGIYSGAAVDSLTPVPATDLGSGECDEGRALRFTATAGTTYRFAVDGSDGDAGRFELHLTGSTAGSRTLTVARAGSGTGTVTSSPAGISCGSDCSEQFEAGSAITLTATPAAGSTFAGWSGGGCSGTGACQLTLGADTTVTATFQPLPVGGDGSSGGPGPGPGPGIGPAPKPKPKPKPLKCKSGFKKVKVKGKQKCVKKKKPGKHKGKKRKGKRRGQK